MRESAVTPTCNSFDRLEDIKGECDDTMRQFDVCLKGRGNPS